MVSTCGKSGTIRVVVRTEASCNRLLMVDLVEQAAQNTVVRALPGIERAHAIEADLADGKRWCLQTEGCSFDTINSLESENGRSVEEDILNLYEVSANDVFATLMSYGVEAARAAIVREVRGVFDVYGISVDARHLSLIADTMTFGGSYRAFNRNGIREGSASPFLHMSFETCSNFLTAAAMKGDKDLLHSPSAKIVMGQLPRQGTGAFELFSDLGGL